MASMQDIADELVRTVDEAFEELESVPEAALTHRPTPNRWTIKEVMGHLIDSAANNHQRFIRAQATGDLTFPKYDQNMWVERQGYAVAEWGELLAFWRSYNRHLSAVIPRIPAEQLATECTIVPFEPVTLRYLVEDYLVHLRHHLDRIRERLAESRPRES